MWRTKRIARISPKTGQVIGWIELTGCSIPRDATGVDVLNGIAYDAAGDRLFVTGKLWPKLFEIEWCRQRAGGTIKPGLAYLVASTPSSPSLAAMSSADVAGFTALSIARILPSLPM